MRHFNPNRHWVSQRIFPNVQQCAEKRKHFGRNKQACAGMLWAIQPSTWQWTSDNRPTDKEKSMGSRNVVLQNLRIPWTRIVNNKEAL